MESARAALRSYNDNEVGILFRLSDYELCQMSIETLFLTALYFFFPGHFSLELGKIVKANWSFTGGNTYNITLEASDGLFYEAKASCWEYSFRGWLWCELHRACKALPDEGAKWYRMLGSPLLVSVLLLSSFVGFCHFGSLFFVVLVLTGTEFRLPSCPISALALGWHLLFAQNSWLDFYAGPSSWFLATREKKKKKTQY